MSFILEKYIFVCNSCSDSVAVYIRDEDEIFEWAICNNCWAERDAVYVGEKVQAIKLKVGE